jgi:hypothetical protein
LVGSPGPVILDVGRIGFLAGKKCDSAVPDVPAPIRWYAGAPASQHVAQVFLGIIA